MSELFDKDVKTIGKHTNNALKEVLEKMERYSSADHYPETYRRQEA